MFSSFERYRKLSKAKGEQKLDKNRKAATKLSTAWVVRLERLLAGENFEDVQAEVDGLYTAQTELYRKKLNELLAERSNMTEDEIAAQQEEYNNTLELVRKNQYRMSKEEKEKVYLLYKQIRQEEFAVLKATNPESSMDDVTILKGKSWHDIVKTIESGLKEPRYITIEDDIKWLRQKIVENKNNSQKYWRFAINRKEFFKHYDQIEELRWQLREKAREAGKTIELVIDDDGVNKKQKRKDIVAPYNYTSEEMKKILVSGWGREHLYFSEFYPQGPLPFDKNRVWTVNEVYDANYWKNVDIAKIEKMDLSPFEKILLVHYIVTESKYHGVSINDTKDFAELRKPHQDVIKTVQNSVKYENLSVDLRTINSERTRTFITSRKARYDDMTDLKQEQKGFVCCGFASSGKAYIDTLDDPNIKCEFMGLSFYNKKTGKCTSAHSLIKVTIKDEEYGIDGEYAWDPCWDSDRRGYAFCLFPLEDYLQYKNNNEIVKVELGEELTAQKAILKANLPDLIDTNEKRLVLDNPKVNVGSKPISFATFDNGLRNLAKKAKETDGGCYLPEDFAISTETKSIHNLYSFDPEQAKNAFYEDMRKYYKQNIEKYPDWQKKFVEYNKGIKYI